MTEPAAFQRGDVILAKFPYADDPSQSKPRPAVIVQNDIGNRFSANLILAAISTRVPRREYPTNLVILRASTLALGSGLDRDSVVHAEVITTVAKTQVIRRLGRLSPDTMNAVDERLRVSLAPS